MEEILIYVALTSCFFAGLSVLYSKVRPRFPIRVNCWFCQKDLVVTYHERNSWDCPFCEQYNGFSADGGYNKPLQAQWSSLLNPNSNSVAGQFKVPNRLCKSCSINQELKIQQLSTFSPKSEETFDAELSRFKLHLEQVYRLCRQCNRTLEIQLAQEEKLLRPEILAWKLDLSRRHGHGRENMIHSAYTKWTRVSKYSGFLCCWVVLTVQLVRYWMENYDTYCSDQHLLLFSEELGINLQTFNFFGFSFAVSNLLLMKRCHLLYISYTLLWAIKILSSFLPLTSLEKLYLAISLGLMTSMDIISNFFKKPKRPSKKVMKFHNKIMLKTETLKDTSLPSTAHHSTPKKNGPCDLDLSKLDISVRTKKSTGSSFSKSPPLRPQCFLRPKPILSPSRLHHSSNLTSSNGNLTKASWVAGGYWQPPSVVPSASYTYPLSRSSSQSSGFGSTQTPLQNCSPADSRPESPFVDTDRLSVFSDQYESINRFSSEFALRYNEDQQSFHAPSVCHGTGLDLSSPSVRLFHGDSKEATRAALNASSQWWLPFMFGFSLAVNVCLGYVFVHSFAYSSGK